MSDKISTREHLSIQDDHIVLREMDEIIWEIGVSEIAVIGEYSMPESVENWGHSILIISKKRDCFEWSCNAVNAEEILKVLNSRLSISTSLKLKPGQGLASLIIFPLDYAEKPLFENRRQEETLIDKMYSFVGVPRYSQYFSSNTWEILERYTPDTKLG